jgi:hypothetical protein
MIGAGTSRAATYPEPASQLRLAGSRQGGTFLMPDTNPPDDLLAPDSVSKGIKRVPYDAEDLMGANLVEGLHQKFGNGHRHHGFSL